MPAAPLPDALRHLAPTLDQRLGGILAAIQQLIAHHFLRIPGLAPIILPFWKHLNRARHCLARLATRIQAGRSLPRSRAGRPRDEADAPPTPPTRAPIPRPPIPRAEAWLLRALGWRVAVHRVGLESLLAEPGMPDLVAAVPSLGRLLRPLCHMLGLPAPCPPPGHRRRRRQPSAPPPPARTRPPAPFNWRPNRSPHPLCQAPFRPAGRAQKPA
jgi:hypothetical protein